MLAAASIKAGPSLITSGYEVASSTSRLGTETSASPDFHTGDHRCSWSSVAH
jgi:hypothetical protein